MKKLCSLTAMLTVFFIMCNLVLPGLPGFPTKTVRADNSSTGADDVDETMQYHYGTQYFDAYLWVPNNTSPGNLKSLVVIKQNLIESTIVYSKAIRDSLAARNSGILFFIMKRSDASNPDVSVANKVMNNFYTRKDYAGNPLYPDSTLSSDTGGTISVYPVIGDASDILNMMLAGIANASGYSEIASKTPLITIGHSAASAFGYVSGNWNPKRVIAQIQLKNGQGAPVYKGNKGIVPGIPSLQYAGQYLEQGAGYSSDGSYADAIWQLSNARGMTTDTKEYLTTHIIEWGSGHFDWSDSGSLMLRDYIAAAIDARVPANFDPTSSDSSKQLIDLTGTGYIATPFAQGQIANAYNNNVGWLSNGQPETGSMTAAQKKVGFWYFSKAFADEVNNFTKYAIPPNPSASGGTYTAKQPYMLIKDPSLASSNTITPNLTFNGTFKSIYPAQKFTNYMNGKYGLLEADSYYMTVIPTTNNNSYDGQGNPCSFPANTKAEIVPLDAPYEIVSSQLVTDASGNLLSDSAQNVGAVTRTTWRYRNNRLHYSLPTLDGDAYIKSPEVGKTDLGNENYSVTSQYKALGLSVSASASTVTGKAAQTLSMSLIDDYNINRYAADSNDIDIPVTITSSDTNLNDLNSDLMVEYGPAKTVRGSDNKWHIQILPDQIPANAQFPIAVNVVASNLGELNSINAAQTSQIFLITNADIPVSQVTVDGNTVSSGDLNTTLAYLQSNAVTGTTDATLTINKSCILGNGYQIKSNGPLTVKSGNKFVAITLTRDSNGPEGSMFNAVNGDITIGETGGNPFAIVDSKYAGGSTSTNNYCALATTSNHNITLNSSVTLTSTSYPSTNKALAYIANNSTFTLSGATINYTAGPLFASDGGSNINVDFNRKVPNVQKLSANTMDINYMNVPSNYQIVDGGDGYYYASATYCDYGVKTGNVTVPYATLDGALGYLYYYNTSNTMLTLIINKDCKLLNYQIGPAAYYKTSYVNFNLISQNPNGVTITRDSSGPSGQMINIQSKYSTVNIGGANSTPITLIDNKFTSGSGTSTSSTCNATIIITNNTTVNLNSSVNITTTSYGISTDKALAFLWKTAVLSLNGAKITMPSDFRLIANGDKAASRTIDFNNKIPTVRTLYNDISAYDNTSYGSYVTLNNIPYGYSKTSALDSSSKTYYQLAATYYKVDNVDLAQAPLSVGSVIIVGNKRFNYDPNATSSDQFLYSSVSDLQTKVQAYYAVSGNVPAGVTYNYAANGVAGFAYADQAAYNSFIASTDLSNANVTLSNYIPNQGQSFNLSITSATGTNGTALSGSVNVNVTSNVSGPLYNSSATFTSGNATIPLSIDTIGTHIITVTITGVTGIRTAVLTVSDGSGAAITPDVQTVTATSVNGNAVLDWELPVEVYSNNTNNAGTVKVYEGYTLLGTYAKDVNTATITGLSAGLNILTLKMIENGVESQGKSVSVDTTNNGKLFANSTIFKDAGGNVISNLKAAGGRTISAKVRVANNTAGNVQTTDLIVARYNADGILIDIKHVNSLPINAGDSQLVTISAIDTSDCSVIKLFAWDSLQNINPLSVLNKLQ